jgi:hypothetical protein
VRVSSARVSQAAAHHGAVGARVRRGAQGSGGVGRRSLHVARHRGRLRAGQERHAWRHHRSVLAARRLR